MIHASNIGVLEIAVDRDRSMCVERKVQFWEEDISGLREAPLLPESSKMSFYKKRLDFKCISSIWAENRGYFPIDFPFA